MAKINLPTDLCSSSGLGTIRKELGVREENMIANVCRIKETSDEILKKFKEVTLAQSLTPDAPIDVEEEIKFYNGRLMKIENIAGASKITFR